MLTHFPIGPTEDQTYMVGRMSPGVAMVEIVYEHLSEISAHSEAARLNNLHEAFQRALKHERELCERRRSLDGQKRED